MPYKGYVIEFISDREDWKYRIADDMKTIVESGQGFPFPIDAEVHAKLYIDRLIGNKDGWIIS
jgi:hypothetical protein